MRAVLLPSATAATLPGRLAIGLRTHAGGPQLGDARQQARRFLRGPAQRMEDVVGVPVVGLVAAAAVVGEVLRRIHGGSGFDALAATMASLEDRECVPSSSRRPWLYGSTPARFDRGGIIARRSSSIQSSMTIATPG